MISPPGRGWCGLLMVDMIFMLTTHPLPLPGRETRESMMSKKQWNVLWLCVGACCLFSANSAAAQENAPGDLRLPEVVITGIDESKIQRPVPKVELLPASFLVMNTSCRDDADDLAQQAALAALLQPRRAEKLYQQAIALDPEYTEAYARLGKVHQASGMYERAKDAYLIALKRDASASGIHYALGILYDSHLREPEKALEQYRAYLEQGGVDARVKLWMRELEEKRQPPEDSSQK